MTSLRIATRKSPLALWQARHVASLLQVRHGVTADLVELTTEGDRFLSAPLSRIGGKGLFIKEIEAAVLDGRADLAVHSLKDVTSRVAEGLVLASFPPREDPRDAFVGRGGPRLFELPKGARIGTSSLRRRCQILERRPDLEIVDLRGNVQTRIRKIEELDLAGAVLAVAGLRRLGLDSQISEVLDPAVCLPAVGQGVLAIECREDDARLRESLAAIEDPVTRRAVTAERAFLARLEGGCTVPLAAYARVSGDRIEVDGLVGRPDGSRVLRSRRAGRPADAERLGTELADELLSAGAKEILAAFGQSDRVPES